MAKGTAGSALPRVRAFVAEHRLLAGAGRVLVGFSGGADSTALLLILRELAPALTAVHLHHGLRGKAADADGRWCQRFCGVRKIKFLSARLEVPRQRRAGESLEAAARRCRLEFWKAHAGADDVVALGHHLDDAVENLLLRLARGGNSSGMTGLRPARSVNGVRLIRPLLCLRRAEIEAFLRGAGVSDWREDRSNADTRLRRNAVRREWLPLIRASVGHDRGLVATLEALRQDAEFLETESARRLPAVADIARLRALPAALLPRVLRLWLSAESGRDVILSRASLERVRCWLARPPAAAAAIPVGQGLSLYVEAGRLQMRHAGAGVAATVWRWRENPRLDLPGTGLTLTARRVSRMPASGTRRQRASDAEYFAAADLPPELVVRAWQPGDRLRPFGAGYEKKVHDVFMDARVPRARRPLVPVVLAGESIMWLAGVRRAEFGRVPAGGRRDRGIVRLGLVAREALG